MSGLAVGNQNLSNILNSVHDNDVRFNGSQKVMLSGNGEITESNERKGLFTAKKTINLITEKTQVSVNILRNALTDAIGMKGLEIFNRYVNAKNISGKQRLTMQSLANIKREVNDYRASKAQQNAGAAANNKLDLSSIKAMGHRQTHESAESLITENMARYFMGLSKSHAHIRDEMRATTNLLKNIPMVYSDSAIKGERGFEKLQITLMDAKEKLGSLITRLDTLLDKVKTGAESTTGEFSDLDANDVKHLSSVNKTLKQHINTILKNIDKNIQSCQIAKNNDGRLYKSFKDGFTTKIQATISMIQEAKGKITAARDGSQDRKFAAKCTAAIIKLNAMETRYNNDLARLESYQLKDEDSVPKNFLKIFKKIGGEAGKEIKKQVNSLKIQGYKLDKHCVMNKFAALMGAKDCWKQNITRTLSLDVDSKPKNFTINLVPAKNINPSLYGQGVNGNPSAAVQSPDLTNCFRSEISDANGKKLFTGYRHGILDAIKVKDDAVRLDYAKNKAKQLLTTIVLDKHPNQLSPTTKNKPLEINLTSVNLVTPLEFMGTGERKMAENHIKALESLTKDANGNIEPIKLTINGTDVWVKVNLRTFLSPCNKFSHGVLGAKIWNNANSIGKNNESFTQLFGGNFLQHNASIANLKSDADFNQRFNEFKQQIDGNSDVGKFINKADLSLADKKKVFVLCQEINLLMQNKNYRNDKVDAFELPARIALLNDMVGNVSCYNCKSGKDRTGHLDIITKQLAVKMTALDNDNMSVGTFFSKSSSLVSCLEGRGYTNANDIQNFDQLAKNSGNLEIHQMNTGLKGSKVNSLNGVVDHFGGKEIFKFYTGASKYVKS